MRRTRHSPKMSVPIDKPEDQEVEPPSAISGLLARCRQGDRDAIDGLFAIVYPELQRRARQQLRRQPPAPLSTTTLVHETFLRMVDRGDANWTDRDHFFAVASLAMRHILVDHARRRLARKRGGGAQVELLDEAKVAMDTRAADLTALDAALERLKSLDERLGRVVDLHFFGGFSFEQIAEALDLSLSTVKREWRKARAFLYQSVMKGAA